MKRTHWLSIGFLVCALLAIFITSNQSTAQEGDPTPTPAFSYINVEAARVRAAPNETALSIGTLLRDARVTPYNRDETGDWVLVEYAQSFGWIRRDLAVWVENIDTLPILMTNSLTPTPAPRTPSATPRLVTLTPVGSYIIARVNVYVRTGPGLSFIPLGILTPGSVVEPLNIDETGTWVLVRYTYNQREEGVTATRVVDGFGWVTRNVVLWTIDINELPILYDDALTPTLTFTPSFTPSATPSETISPTVTASPSPTNTDIPTETPSATVTNTEIPTELPSATVTNTDIPTETPSATVTNTDIPTQTPNPTSTNTEFPTETPNPTSTNTETPTELPSATVTNTDIPTETPNPTSTNTDIPTEFPTNTDIPSETPAEMTMAVVMNTDIPTETPTNTEIPSETPTITDAPTETPNPTSTNTDIPTETPQPTITNTPTLSGNATAIEELTPLPTSEITPEVAIAQTLTETPLVSVNVDEPPTSSASLPIEAILAGFVLFFIILYVLMYWRGQAAIDRYANGFVIDTCPVCRTGHLEVETRIVRWFGIPRPRRTVRCDNCRSLLRETGAHRWRYAVDKLANLAMYDRYNGLEVDERTLQKLSENPIRSSGDE